MPRRPLRILTWHVHGNYLYYLSQVPHRFIVPYDHERSPGYAGRAGTLPWGDNVEEIPLDAIRRTQLDCVLYQSRRGWTEDQQSFLTAAQRALPRIYLEHDPPQEHPTNTRHFIDDPATLLVHCTHFNELMWDSGRTPTRVVEHGVKLLAPASYTGELARGISVVNHLERRGRRLGADVFERVRSRIPLDLIGMEASRSGGLGEVENHKVAATVAHYRFFFNPIRWTSLGLAVIEAMMVGAPIVGLATTELVSVIRDGHSGYIDTRVDRLMSAMEHLLEQPGAARELGAAAQRVARERFGIGRFVDDWLDVFRSVTA